MKLINYYFSNKDQNKMVEIIKKSMDKIKMLIGINKIEILYESLKFVNDLCSSQRGVILQQKHEFDKLLNGIQDW